MEQQEWLRYSCQVALPGFGAAGQQRLQDAKVLIVGAGGLGCPAAQYLVSSGIGKIGIADFDVVSISNLHRQVLYSPANVGSLKAEIICKKLQEQNPQVTITPIVQRITAANVLSIIEHYDIVVDGTDNFDTKYLLNDACVLKGKPLVYAAIYQYEGQAAVLNVRNNDGSYSPNYRDIFPDANAADIPNCAEGGVIPAIAGIMGCIQANEVIKYLAGTGDLLAGKLLVFDAATLQSRIIKLGAVSQVSITRLPEPDEVPLITAKDLREGMDNDLYYVVDVRSEDERARFSIGGIHIPLSEVGSAAAQFYPGKPIVFYCESGRRSASAVRTSHMQFPSLTFLSLEGGMKAWKEMKAVAAN